MAFLRKSRSYPGQGMVEFSIVLPIFFVLTFGIVEMGWLVYTNHTLSSATREGARFAMVRGEMSEQLATVATVEEVVRDRSGALSGEISVTDVAFEPDASPGSQVTIRTEYEYQPIIGMILGITPMTLSSDSTVIVQH